MSLVRHSNGVWTAPAAVASTSSLGLDLSHTPNEPADNRSFGCDGAGDATVVGWGNVQNSNLVAVSGNLNTNNWGAANVISGSDQNPGYFRLAVSSAGQAIVAYPLTLSSNINTGGGYSHAPQHQQQQMYQQPAPPGYPMQNQAYGYGPPQPAARRDA